MKRMFLAVAVALSMIFILSACGGNAESDKPDAVIDAQTEDYTDTKPDVSPGIQENSEEDIINSSEPEPDMSETAQPDAEQPENESEQEEQEEMKMNVQIGNYNFTATLENNTAVEELVAMMKEGPVTIQMDDYSGFEKVGALGRSLTTSNSQTTTHAGDIVLYNGNNIVMFYGSNSWSYTRIGKIDDLTDWKTALGSGSITAVFTLL